MEKSEFDKELDKRYGEGFSKIWNKFWNKCPECGAETIHCPHCQQVLCPKGCDN